MARPCSICTHNDRESIDKSLVSGESCRKVAESFGIGESSVHRHKREHLPALLAKAMEREEEHAGELQALVKAQDQQEQEQAINVIEELRRCFQRVNLLFDACDRWLRDPEDPSRYDIGPRADDVKVIYMEMGPDDKLIRKKAPLSQLIARLERNGFDVQSYETKHADPRELVLKTAERLQGQSELLAKLLGQLQETQAINIILAPQWVELRTTILSALDPYPEAKLALAEVLRASS